MKVKLISLLLLAMATSCSKDEMLTIPQLTVYESTEVHLYMNKAEATVIVNDVSKTMVCPSQCVNVITVDSLNSLEIIKISSGEVKLVIKDFKKGVNMVYGNINGFVIIK